MYAHCDTTVADLLGSSRSEPYNATLYDHRPFKVNDDDYDRICRIPRKKGASFRNLKGVRVNPADNTVYFDPDVKRVLLKSGNPLVPDYAMSFKEGKSSKPFGRKQDWVLTVRENARLQGFPDYYKLCWPLKERYMQVGNAVAVLVARPLGYALGRAFIGSVDDSSMFEFPPGFPNYLEALPSP
ncbi:DNA (cytosine-5)-methyltransferase 1-like [Argentina anserina]|uniref:DNA (cytosine-5)-methyltransferase 1-like n=1 Tax=Argentina anserina TaxID=57926 RepID=UPI00217659FC|nr:DNA (cytosine-5)-methyltransferase 1-like [Potentilla anserina]